MEESPAEKDYSMLQTTVVVNEKIGAGYGQIGPYEASLEEAQEVAETCRRHLVPVSPDAPSCCIDGRPCLHTLAGIASQPRPSVAGGATVTAYAAAELIGYFDDSDLSPEERALAIDTTLNEAGIPTGNHVDASNNAAAYEGNKTGCGANDRLSENLGHVDSDKEAVDGMTALLLGEAFSVEATQYSGRKTAATRNAKWNPVLLTNAIADRSVDAIEVLASDETPTHGHNEILVVFNTVEGMTVDRDALVAETGKQVFVVDLWYINKLAHALAPNDAYKYQQLRHAMTAYQVGTYLTLCNGTQRPVIISDALPQAA